MSVEYGGENDLNTSFKSYTILGSPKTPRMVRGIMKSFGIENEQKAGRVLVGISIFCFLLTLGILFYTLFPVTWYRLFH